MWNHSKLWENFNLYCGPQIFFFCPFVKAFVFKYVSESLLDFINDKCVLIFCWCRSNLLNCHVIMIRLNKQANLKKLSRGEFQTPCEFCKSGQLFPGKNGCFRIWPSRDTSTDCRGIRPSMDTSTYRHQDVGYGHSSQKHNAPGVQHCFMTPEQGRHVTN